MNPAFACLPCLVRQTLDATELLNNQPVERERILKQAFLELANTDLKQPPPQVAAKINRMVREQTGIFDPYKRIKEEQNRIAAECGRKLKNAGGGRSFSK